MSNRAALENFRIIGERFFEKRRDVPVLTASTLIVPGYVDAEEAGKLAEFIASISPEIPYTLLAFYPQYRLNDLPTTSWRQMLECEKAAEKHLKRIEIGNIHLLS